MSFNRRIVTPFGVFLFLALAAMAAVPNLITYQGRLTDSAGVPVADHGYNIILRIYDTDAGGSPLWSDTMLVATQGGLFTALLGSEQPLSPSVFDGAIRYLGITMLGQAEMIPRTPIVSVPYAMMAGNAATGDVDCHSCDTIFINSVGPETFTAVNADTALKIYNSGDDAKCGVNIRVEGTNNYDDMTAIRGSCTNYAEGSHAVYGGIFLAGGGDGLRYGVYGQGLNNSPTLPAYGVFGHGQNYSIGGQAYGGYFTANGSDPSHHYGAYGYAYAHDNAQATGILGSGTNPDVGRAFGGRFSTGSSGIGRHFGVFSISNAENDSAAAGVYGYTSNTGNGDAIGGEFTAANAGFGYHYGVSATAEANNTNAARGVYGFAVNYGMGDAYGGQFVGDSLGSNIFHLGVYGRGLGIQHYTYGVYGSSRNRGSYLSAGVYGTADNNGDGPAQGGHFASTPTTGEGYGVYASTYTNYGSSPIYGVYGAARGYLTNIAAYGGYFTSTTHNNALQYGLYCLADSSTGTYQIYGIYGRSQHSGSGTSYASYFLADSTGTGTSYGTRTIALSKSTATAYGITGIGANKSSGTVYGGYFEALNYGTGTRYGVYGKAPSALGYAGYFSGDLRATGDLTVVGTKSAAVKMDDGDYRLVYCQESPENWFEDFGEGRLVNGRVIIEIDPLFAQTANTGMTYHVFLTPQEEPVILAVANRTPTSFEVRGPAGSNVRFSYRIVAKRRGYEDIRLARMSGPTPEETAAEEASLEAERQADEETADKARLVEQASRARSEAMLENVPDSDSQDSSIR